MKTLLVFCFLACSIFASAQFNRVIYDSIKAENILYGECNREGFLNGDFEKWFTPEYNAFVVNEKVFNPDYRVQFDSIYVLLATWCSDSQREVPRFCKIMDTEYFKGTNVKYFCFDGNKKNDVIDSEAFYLQYVPTIIFYYHGDELCRIVETPRISLEEDIMDLLSRIQP
jgi:hypothetical protein